MRRGHFYFGWKGIACALLLSAAAWPAWGDQVTKLYQQGYNAYHAREYAKAVKCWSDVLALDPKDAKALTNRALACKELKEWDKAAADATAAIALTPDDIAAYTLRGDIYHEKRMSLINKPGTVHKEPAEIPDAEQAVADYTEALRLGSLHEAKPGDWAMQEGQRSVGYNGEKEIAGYNLALAADPDNTKLLMARAWQYQDLWEWDKAVADYDAVLKLLPGDRTALEQRARTFGQKQGTATKMLPDAMAKQIDDLSELVRVKGGSASYVRRGEVYERMGDYDKAMADYEQALKISNGKDDGAYGGMMDIYEARGDIQKAIESYNHIIAANDYGDLCNHAAIYEDRARLYLEAGEYEKSIADVNKAMEGQRESMVQIRAEDNANDDGGAHGLLEMDEKDNRQSMGAYYVMRGEAWLRAGSYANALADFDSGIAENAGGTRALNAKAWLKAACGDAKFRDSAQAVELAVKSCEHGWWQKSGDIDTLATAYAGNGKWDQAVAYENMAIKVAQEDGAMPDRSAAAEKDQAGLIKSYNARLAMYQQKKPFRGIKELADWEE